MSAEPGSSAVSADTLTPCPAHQGCFPAQKEAPGTQSLRSHSFKERGYGGDTPNHRATQALSCCRGSDASIKAICQGECGIKNRAQSGGHGLTYQHDLESTIL